MNKLWPEKNTWITVAISAIVAVLAHLPELIALSSEDGLYPEIRIVDVTSEVLFTFISVVILFRLNHIILRLDTDVTDISWKRLAASFILTWAASSLLGKGFVFLHKHFAIPAIDAMLHHYLHPLRDFLLACIAVGSCYLFYLNRKSKKVLIDNQRLRAENILNQYESLKSQLNPHMLFNSLNTLYSLIRENPEKAQIYVDELSKVLRYTLKDSKSDTVTLEEEMKFVRSYIFILKMRYEENLSFDISIAPECNYLKLPTMAVQLLIENAVKHNEISNRKPLLIHITANGHRLEVSNCLQPKLTDEPSTGIGLDNLSKRYRLLFKQEIEIKADGKSFTVSIPLI